MALQIKTLAELNLTSAGTAQALSATSILAQVVYINAKTTNAGNIYIGDSNVASNRYLVLLDAGESVSIEASEFGTSGDLDLSEIYFDGGTTNDDIYVGYIQRQN